MREYEIVLAEVLDADGKPLTVVEGSLIIKVPNYVERLKLMESQGIKPDMGADLKSIIKIVETSAKFVVKVDAVIDGEEIKSFEDLGVYQKGVHVINYIFSILAGGIPSKKS